MKPTAVLRLCAPGDAIEKILSLVPRQRVESQWPSNGDEPAAANVFLAEKETIEEVLRSSLALLQAKKELFVEMGRLGAEMELDVGHPMEAGHVETPFSISAKEMKILVDLGIDLTSTVYPT